VGPRLQYLKNILHLNSRLAGLRITEVREFTNKVKPQSKSQKIIDQVPWNLKYRVALAFEMGYRRSTSTEGVNTDLLSTPMPHFVKRLWDTVSAACRPGTRGWLFSISSGSYTTGHINGPRKSTELCLWWTRQVVRLSRLTVPLAYRPCQTKLNISECTPTFFLFLWCWGLNSGPSPWATPPALFLWRVLRDRVLWTICPGWPQTSILLISASWAAGITGVSHWRPLVTPLLNKFGKPTTIFIGITSLITSSRN
jgi:hypothetical protein